MNRLRIFVADDHPIFRTGLRALLESVGDMEIIGEAETGDAAVTLIPPLEPDVILMDIQMPGLNGIEATRRLQQTDATVKVLMLTMFEDDASVFAAIRAGARGYLLKGARPDETVRAIRAVANGEVIFSPGVAHQVINYFSQAQSASLPATFPELTQRETAILELLAQRRSNAEIAERLVLSPKTVRNYVSTILDKLQVRDRAEAMLTARAAGLGRGTT